LFVVDTALTLFDIRAFHGGENKIPIFLDCCAV